MLCRLFGDGGYVHRNKVVELYLQIHRTHRHVEGQPDTLSAALGTPPPAPLSLSSFFFVVVFRSFSFSLFFVLLTPALTSINCVD